MLLFVYSYIIYYVFTLEPVSGYHQSAHTHPIKNANQKHAPVIEVPLSITSTGNPPGVSKAEVLFFVFLVNVEHTVVDQRPMRWLQEQMIQL